MERPAKCQPALQLSNPEVPMLLKVCTAYVPVHRELTPLKDEKE